MVGDKCVWSICIDIQSDKLRGMRYAHVYVRSLMVYARPGGEMTMVFGFMRGLSTYLMLKPVLAWDRQDRS